MSPSYAMFRTSIIIFHLSVSLTKYILGSIVYFILLYDGCCTIFKLVLISTSSSTGTFYNLLRPFLVWGQNVPKYVTVLKNDLMMLGEIFVDWYWVVPTNIFATSLGRAQICLNMVDNVRNFIVCSKFIG